MNIEFQLTRKDYSEFIKFAYARMTRIGKGHIKFTALNLVAWIFIGIFLTGMYNFINIYDGFYDLPLFISLSALAIAVILLGCMAIYQRRFFLHYSIADDGHLLKRQSANITGDSIDITTSDSRQSYSWSAVQEKGRSKELVYLFIDNNQALLFPRRAFASEEKFEEFMSLIDSKISPKETRA